MTLEVWIILIPLFEDWHNIQQAVRKDIDAGSACSIGSAILVEAVNGVVVVDVGSLVAGSHELRVAMAKV
jgi:hypothetical protein